MLVSQPQLQQCLLSALQSISPNIPVQFRAMFGGRAAYAFGRVFASLSNRGLAIKLSASQQQNLLAVPNTHRLQYHPQSPPSKHYVVVSEQLLHNPNELGFWLEQSLQYVQTLPASQGAPSA